MRKTAFLLTLDFSTFCLTCRILPHPSLRSDLAAQFEERARALDAQWAAKHGEHECALAAVVADTEVPLLRIRGQT